jgi:hypothetical protein
MGVSDQRLLHGLFPLGKWPRYQLYRLSVLQSLSGRYGQENNLSLCWTSNLSRPFLRLSSHRLTCHHSRSWKYRWYKLCWIVYVCVLLLAHITRVWNLALASKPRRDIYSVVWNFQKYGWRVCDNIRESGDPSRMRQVISGTPLIIIIIIIITPWLFSPRANYTDGATAACRRS